MKRGRKTIYGKRQHVDITLNSKTIKATDVIAEMFGTTRTEVIELGLAYVFQNAIDLISQDLGAGQN